MWLKGKTKLNIYDYDYSQICYHDTKVISIEVINSRKYNINYTRIRWLIQLAYIMCTLCSKQNLKDYFPLQSKSVCTL